MSETKSCKTPPFPPFLKSQSIMNRRPKKCCVLDSHSQHSYFLPFSKSMIWRHKSIASSTLTHTLPSQVNRTDENHLPSNLPPSKWFPHLSIFLLAIFWHQHFPRHLEVERWLRMEGENINISPHTKEKTLLVSGFTEGHFLCKIIHCL